MIFLGGERGQVQKRICVSIYDWCLQLRATPTARAQGSPTLRTLSRESYRHALAVTAVRPGQGGEPFLVTLNLACPQDLWEDAKGAFAESVASFRYRGACVAPELVWLFGLG